MSEPPQPMACDKASPHSQSNPIDLTLEDDSGYSPFCDRKKKRICPESRSFNAANDVSRTLNHLHIESQHSGLSPAMSTSTLVPDGQPSSHPTHRPHPPSWPSTPQSMTPTLRPAFNGPSDSSAFFPRPPQPGPSSLAAPQPQVGSHMYRPSPGPAMQMQSSSQPPPHNSSRQVIDLTVSPSPPPISRPSSQQAQIAPPVLQQAFQPPAQPPLPPDLPPKTPVCIGQLTVTALVLYPVAYIQPQYSSGAADSEWAPVRMNYEHNASKQDSETIHIRTPNLTRPDGEVIPSESFGVVEQKVANYLGPMLGKGLIRLDGKVRRGPANLPILPLSLLVYTPKGNITAVANYLHTRGLFLDHPTLPSDIQRLRTQHYFNPHNPPPGGHSRALLGPNNRPGYAGPGGSNLGRFNTMGKSVEVQRSQVDELFKSMKDGDELPETEAPPELATTLYPHQKKALTFMLERELERTGATNPSLWQERYNPISRERSWFHLITQREVFEPPPPTKGAILADDMGLGKTISCVALLAATSQSARTFSATPMEPPQPPPPPEPPLSAEHFSGSVWGMPPPADAAPGKGKARAARQAEKWEADYVRMCRIRIKSRATLIVCPLSTVVNWEEQFREHWRGEVEVVGGSGVCPAAAAGGPSAAQGLASGSKSNGKAAARRVREGPPLRVYVYHGNARKPDPTFLADFDAVITTYSTLAVEYSKQVKSLEGTEDDDDDAGTNSDGFIETDERGNKIIQLGKPPKKMNAKKRKKNACSSVMEASSPLQSVYWFRVVLDEAHSIKEVSTVACRACCDLIADRRLCLTGTPVQNKLDDVYALLKFLRLEPFDDKAIWTEFIGGPVKYGQALGVARLQSIMRSITLRRTKESKAENGQRILTLPPRRDELRYLKFDEQEQAIYDQFFTESKAEFNELSDKNEVMKNYVGILQKILRLRQICDHYELVMNKGLGLPGDAPNFEDLALAISKEGIDVNRAAAVFSLLKEAGTAQCVDCGFEMGIPSESADGDACYDDSAPAKRGRKPKAMASSRASTRHSSPSNVIHAVVTRCQHLFCMGCFRNSCCPNWPNDPQDVKRSCAVCQAPLNPNDYIDLIPDTLPNEGPSKKKQGKREKRQKGNATFESIHMSTKIRALLADLMQFSRANPHSANYDPASIEIQMVDNEGNNIDEGVVKTVVFSQWTSMLDKIEDALEAAGIKYDRLDGTMKRDDRTRAMEALKHDPACEVLLVSLKAGGVGLNLTAAQRVYLMDPYWNPAVENQAVDRIHRLGQTRPVTTVKLIIEKSIEDRLLEVQRKKTELANMTLSQNYTKAEILQRRMEELNALFGG